MAKVLSAITVNAPTGPITPAVNDAFAFTGTPTLTGSGGTQRYDQRWEVDAGSGFVPIAASGTGLITAGTNPLVNTNSTGANSITVTVEAPGSYTIRMVGAPTSGGAYTVTSATRTVTVSAPSITGTAALAADEAVLAGSGSQVVPVTGTAAVTADEATLAATGAERFSGTSALAVDEATLAGSGAESFTGTAAVTAGEAALAGTGNQASGGAAVTGTSAMSIDEATLAASGAEAMAGTGAVLVDEVALAATGAERFSGTAGITVEGATIAGEGTQPPPPITGTASLVGAEARIDGGVWIESPEVRQATKRRLRLMYYGLRW
jgi:hypothetical protein